MDKTPAIHLACKTGDADVVARLLAVDRRLVHATDHFQNTPLHEAANLAVAQLLIKNNADVKMLGWMGSTPLHRAAQRGLHDVAELLIRTGADVGARRTERLDTPLHWAATEAVVKVLVENGADVSARDWSGRTPLHWAAQFGCAEVIRYLLECGANVNDVASAGGDDDLQETPLHSAPGGGNIVAIRALVENGADVNATDRHGRTPLHKAAFAGQAAVVEMLAKSGANLNFRNASGQKPIHEAQRPEIKDLFKQLMGPGHSVDVPLTDPPAGLRLAIKKIRINASRHEAVAISHNAVLTRWSLESPPRMLAGLQTHHPYIIDMAVIPGSDEFIASIPDGVEIRQWDDLQFARILSPVNSEWKRVSALAVSPSGLWIAVIDRPERLRLFEKNSGQVTACVKPGERTIAVRFSPDSRLLATACSFQGGGHIRVDAVGDDGTLTERLKLDRSVHNSRASQFVDTLARVEFSADGTRLALFETSAIYHDARPRGWRGDVVVYEIPSGCEIWSASIDERSTGDSRVLKDAGYPMGFITDVAFSPDGAVVACGATNGVILNYAVNDGSLVRRLKVHDSAAVTALAFDPTSGQLFVGLGNGELLALSETESVRLFAGPTDNCAEEY